MNQVNILGIKLSIIDRAGALKRVEAFLAGDRPRFLVTPNPEIVLAANHDEELFHILNKADLSLMDGMGLKAAGWLKGVNAPRVTGADLVPDLLAMAEERQLSVLVVNWREGLSSATDIETALKARYPRLKVSVQAVDRFGRDFSPSLVGAPSIMLVTLGAPYQEKFVFHNLEKVPGLRLAVGIGGALDFISGKVKRAPKLMRLLGLEWSWRLFQKPSNAQGQVVFRRYQRIWRAVFVFMWRFLVWQFIRPRLYRPNVACLIYRRQNERYQVLVVRRSYSAEPHWQLPQGGTDGEDPKDAGLREATEELGTDKFEVKAVFKDVWRYDFNGALGKHQVTRDSGYKGQKQSLAVIEFLGDDAEIKLNYWDHDFWQWVDTDRLVATVHHVRRKSTQVFLDKFNEYLKQI
ncbi:WecB/TagA/CpsF family glycosyltransferase [Candidatus Falkowbacteria bacterium]|nr:WecB/TagA/CpsF family glycosyltransferase [Candidatus Falkowbacteria bacterium]